MISEASLKNIENLHRLKNEGIVTQEEFDLAKAAIFSDQTIGQPSTSDYRQSFQLRAEPGSPLEWMVKPLNRYLDFTGRSSRQEFWMFVLGQAVVYAGLLLMLGILDHEVTAEKPVIVFCALALVLFIAATIIPNIAVQIRRFHDQDMVGWFVLLNLIPYIGSFIVLVLMCKEGTKGANRFGPDPLATEE
jgi:uncharacterized membrane protein YhaH (DUF805 family)